MKNKVILMGAHGLGKTTALKSFAEKGYIVIPEIIRDIIKYGKYPFTTSK